MVIIIIIIIIQKNCVNNQTILFFQDRKAINYRRSFFFRFLIEAIISYNNKRKINKIKFRNSTKYLKL